MSVNLQTISAAADILLPDAGNSTVEEREALMSLEVRRSMDTILKSNALKQAIRMFGSTKLSKTQIAKFRLSFTAAIVETGSPSSGPKTS